MAYLTDDSEEMKKIACFMVAQFKFEQNPIAEFKQWLIGQNPKGPNDSTFQICLNSKQAHYLGSYHTFEQHLRSLLPESADIFRECARNSVCEINNAISPISAEDLATVSSVLIFFSDKDELRGFIDGLHSIVDQYDFEEYFQHYLDTAFGVAGQRLSAPPLTVDIAIDSLTENKALIPDNLRSGICQMIAHLNGYTRNLSKNLSLYADPNDVQIDPQRQPLNIADGTALFEHITNTHNKLTAWMRCPNANTLEKVVRPEISELISQFNYHIYLIGHCLNTPCSLQEETISDLQRLRDGYTGTVKKLHSLSQIITETIDNKDSFLER